MERRFRRWIRWNAAIMVHRAQRPGVGVGGHISTYASSASLYEVGFNHFFRGKAHPGGGDQVFIQGHASPGIYARAFLEGRLSADRLDGFRQEHSHAGGGLPSGSTMVKSVMPARTPQPHEIDAAIATRTGMRFCKVSNRTSQAAYQCRSRCARRRGNVVAGRAVWSAPRENDASPAHRSAPGSGGSDRGRDQMS